MKGKKMSKDTIEVGAIVIFHAKNAQGDGEPFKLNGKQAEVLKLDANQEGDVERHRIRFLSGSRPFMLAAVAELTLAE